MALTPVIGYFPILYNPQVFVYAINPDNGSPWRDKIQSVAEHFVDVHALSAKEAAQRMRDDRWVLLESQ